jgi:tetratricopeptide (TPR) repeat protein
VTRRYKAFISYSWADRAWGEWLHRTLETYRAPKGVADGQTLHPIFKDREEEAAGGSVGAAIEAALEASEFLIVICSPRSAKSTWVNREVAWFKTHKDKGRVLALIVDGEPGAGTTPGREGEECFPKTLTMKVGADLQPTEEWEDAPLAADARAEGDGRRGAKLKLAAALLGVGLDALVRRDERRRTIRRRWAMSGMAAGMATLASLSLYAFTQRDAAVVARNDAVKARDDAEGIIELILTDLKSDLEGFGTLKSVTAIGNRAIGYYEGQDVKALTPDQLGRRARVLLMLGEADNKRGDLTAALARYETAAATTSEQLARDPENAQRIFDHAQSVFWVGYIAWQRGDHAKAKEQFTEYHRLATRLVEIDPENDDWQAELEYSYSNLGTLAMDEGAAAEAEGWFRKSLEVSSRLLEKNPDYIDRVLAVGQSYQWLADALHRQAKLVLARATRREEIIPICAGRDSLGIHSAGEC